jgi:Ca-activated chloride channel family protein
MRFADPIYLLALLLVPLAIGAHLLAARRRRRHAIRFTAMPALKAAVGGIPAWRRHAGAALIVAALTTLGLALAKPQRTVAVPLDRASIMLVTDHSRSMLATDVEPDRLRAGKKAATAFLDEVPSRVRVGIVTFSDTPDSVHAPSQDKSAVRAAIAAQTADGATATGEALEVAIDTITQDRSNGRRAPAAIVLLSDGKTTVGGDPVDVAEKARRLKIPIYTVSLGTRTATVPNPGFGPPLAAAPDPATLARIAEVSDGRSYSAEDDEELSAIYKALGSQLGTKKQHREITAGFALMGSVLLLGAAAASVRWSGRLP